MYDVQVHGPMSGHQILLLECRGTLTCTVLEKFPACSQDGLACLTLQPTHSVTYQLFHGIAVCACM